MRLFVKDRNFYKTLIAFALPIVLQQLINVGVNMADNIMIGQLGETSMGGVSQANNFIMIYNIVCMGLGMGASVLTSRFHGMEDNEGIKKTINIMYRLLFATVIAFSLATLLFPSQIMSIYTDDAGINAVGVGYLLISTPCYFLNGYNVTTSIVLRTVGKANIPLLSSCCSFMINIFFNWVFIFGNLGAPVMGANGAALGTLIARVVEFSITMTYLFVFDKTICMRIKDLFMDVKDLVKEYIRISIPVLVSDTLLGVGSSAVGAVLGHIGKTFVAANSITSVVMQLAQVATLGVSQASCTLTGITLGKGEVEKAKEQGMTLGRIGLIIGIVGCGIIMLIADPVISLYNINEETRLLAKELMDALGIVMIFQCYNSILTKGVLRGGGDTKFLMVADIIFLWIFSIPLGILCGIYLKLPGFWIYMAIKIDQFLKSILCFYRIRTDKWIKKISRK